MNEPEFENKVEGNSKSLLRSINKSLVKQTYCPRNKEFQFQRLIKQDPDS